MREIINNTSISDSDHIKPLININFENKITEKKEVIDEDLAGKVGKEEQLIQKTKGEKIDEIIGLPNVRNKARAAAAAGGRKRKRKTKKRVKKKKKSISNNKYLTKKTRRKKRRKKRSLKN